jgi:hypothetical protein
MDDISNADGLSIDDIVEQTVTEPEEVTSDE